MATAFLAILISIAVVYTVPRMGGRERLKKATIASGNVNAWVVPKLLVLTFIVSTGIGVFEVGLALRGKQYLGLTPYQIAIMFSECSLVMFVMQGVVFASWIKPDITRWFISPALVALAGGLFLGL